jgi:hypothetical protein
MIVAVIALIIVGFWLPILWIPAAIIVVLGVAYLIRLGRDAATGRTSDVERDPSP